MSSARSFSIGPIRSLGPGRSCSSATGRPARSAAWRTRAAVSACCSCGAVAEVQARHVHPRADHGQQDLRIGGRGPDGGDDLGAAHGGANIARGARGPAWEDRADARCRPRAPHRDPVGGPTAVLGARRAAAHRRPDVRPARHLRARRRPQDLVKTTGPALAPEALGPLDVALVSHDHHPDNLDAAGRELLATIPLVLTDHRGRRAPGRHGGGARAVGAARAGAARRRHAPRDRGPRPARPGRDRPPDRAGDRLPPGRGRRARDLRQRRQRVARRRAVGSPRAGRTSPRGSTAATAFAAAGLADRLPSSRPARRPRSEACPPGHRAGSVTATATADRVHGGRAPHDDDDHARPRARKTAEPVSDESRRRAPARAGAGARRGRGAALRPRGEHGHEDAEPERAAELVGDVDEARGGARRRRGATPAMPGGRSAASKRDAHAERRGAAAAARCRGSTCVSSRRAGSATPCRSSASGSAADEHAASCRRARVEPRDDLDHREHHQRSSAGTRGRPASGL